MVWSAVDNLFMLAHKSVKLNPVSVGVAELIGVGVILAVDVNRGVGVFMGVAELRGVRLGIRVGRIQMVGEFPGVNVGI